MRSRQAVGRGSRRTPVAIVHSCTTYTGQVYNLPLLESLLRPLHDVTSQFIVIIMMDNDCERGVIRCVNHDVTIPNPGPKSLDCADQRVLPWTPRSSTGVADLPLGSATSACRGCRSKGCTCHAGQTLLARVFSIDSASGDAGNSRLDTDAMVVRMPGRLGALVLESPARTGIR